MIGFDPLSIGVGVLVWLAFKKQSGTKFGEVTPEREELYRNAMAHCQDPEKLRKLADIFKKEGLRGQAFLLTKRADWRARTMDVRKKHQEIFDAALKSDNVQAVLGVAAAFDEMTATFKASQLRERAKNLQETNLQKDAKKEATSGDQPADSAEA